MRSTYWALGIVLLAFGLGFLLGSGIMEKSAVAQGQPAPGPIPPRFQISAYAGPVGAHNVTNVSHGCYIIDTVTGEVWHTRYGGKAEKVSDKLR